jgi:hypothetical protein
VERFDDCIGFGCPRGARANAAQKCWDTSLALWPVQPSQVAAAWFKQGVAASLLTSVQRAKCKGKLTEGNMDLSDALLIQDLALCHQLLVLQRILLAARLHSLPCD